MLSANLEMSPDTIKTKCQNFLSTLIRLAGDETTKTASNVKKLIQNLIDGAIEPEEFSTQLQKELQSNHQPYLIHFLKKSLPHVRQALISGEMTIEGIRPPPVPASLQNLVPTTQIGTLRPILAPTSRGIVNNTGGNSALAAQLSQPLSGNTILTQRLISVLHADEYECKSKVQPVKVSERHRKSPYPMISVPEAVEIILKESYTLDTEWKYFRDSFGHILSENVIATEAYPPFPASIKDGYAVLADDTSSVRKVIGTVSPGCQLDFDLKPGCCVRVSTGSAIPDRADAVIQVEDTSVVDKDEEGNEISIGIEIQVKKPLQDIRPVGSDVSKNEILIPENHKISAAEIGVLATCGIQKVLVYQKPLVAVLSTGDEVLEPGTPLQPGCIRDSNKSSLRYMLYENRIATFDAGIARDFADDIKSKLIAAFKAADIIVTTGSVSMGEKDILKEVLKQDFDAVVHFGRVHMKPGKPATFSTACFEGKKKLIFSLPGNPVSAFVCFYLFILPCIKKLMGFKEPRHGTIKVELAHDISLDERPEFYRVFLKSNEEGVFVAHSTGGQQSSRLLSLQKADALLVLPPGSTQLSVLKAGSKVDAILMNSI